MSLCYLLGFSNCFTLPPVEVEFCSRIELVKRGLLGTPSTQLPIVPTAPLDLYFAQSRVTLRSGFVGEINTRGSRTASRCDDWSQVLPVGAWSVEDSRVGNVPSTPTESRSPPPTVSGRIRRLRNHGWSRSSTTTGSPYSAVNVTVSAGIPNCGFDSSNLVCSDNR